MTARSKTARKIMKSSSTTAPATRRWLIVAWTLIALSTILFVTGVIIERGTAAPSTSIHQTAQSGETPSGDADGGHEQTVSGDADGGHEAGGAGEERILGLDLENPWIVGAFVIVWIGLAVALLRFGRAAWAATLGVALVATVLDVAEAGRQVAEAHAVLVTFAVLVALAHLALVILAGLVLARARQGQTVTVN